MRELVAQDVVDMTSWDYTCEGGVREELRDIGVKEYLQTLIQPKKESLDRSALGVHVYNEYGPLENEGVSGLDM